MFEQHQSNSDLEMKRCMEQKSDDMVNVHEKLEKLTEMITSQQQSNQNLTKMFEQHQTKSDLDIQKYMEKNKEMQTQLETWANQSLMLTQNFKKIQNDDKRNLENQIDNLQETIKELFENLDKNNIQINEMQNRSFGRKNKCSICREYGHNKATCLRNQTEMIFSGNDDSNSVSL